MTKLLPLTALALGLSSGVALADRSGGFHGGDHRGPDHRAVTVEHRAPAPAARDHRSGTVVVRDNHDWHGGGRVIVNRGYGNYNRGYGNYNRGYGNYNRGNGSHGYGYGVVRRPIFVSRPIIRERYYNYYRRPALVVENYSPMNGYYWVPGQWSWSGYEWTWQPGHYQPDTNYVDPGYDDPGYDGY
jgi:hypothetical protein